MDSLISKLSTYDLFTNLVPGFCFYTFLTVCCGVTLNIDSIVIIFFVAYLLGLIIGRIGSIIIEPILKGINFVTFRDYNDYLVARSKTDSFRKDIDILSEKSNMYRSIISLILCSMVLWLCFCEFSFILLLIFISLFVIFLFSYRKQVTYLKEKIDFIINLP